MTEWRELKTLQDVAVAQAAGDEVQVNYDGDWDPLDGEYWAPWEGEYWAGDREYRARPRKKTKTVVLREALFRNYAGEYHAGWVSGNLNHPVFEFVRWLDTPERVVEVEE